MLSKFPRVMPTQLNINKFIDFLGDEETIEKKNRLFSWQSQIERELRNGSINTNEIYDLMESELDDYISWLNLYIQDTKYTILRGVLIEIVLGIAISNFTHPVMGLLGVVAGLVSFNKRLIELNKQELQAQGHQLAYIVHAERKLENIITKDI